MTNYRVDLRRVVSGFDGETCWVHPRAGAIPPAEAGGAPTAVLTTQKLLLSGSDVFYALHSAHSTDLGETWSALTEQQNYRRVVLDHGVEKTVCDFYPKWHAATGTVLGIGQTVYYDDNRVTHAQTSEVAYGAYDAQTHRWRDWNTLRMPEGDKFRHTGAGCAQRVDLPDGQVLLPVRFQVQEQPRRLATTVVRCAFDGETLEYIEHGREMSVPESRGLCEASVIQLGGRFFLTLRNDITGYVAVSDDGLDYSCPRPWCFDNGDNLGNYNTQQHWVKHADALFLVYTRRGLDNDHVFRHRAPLVMARVDTERLCVIRETERVLVPERGARLGNFGVTHVTENETWVTVAEWMQPAGCEEHGSDNTIWIARRLWD